MISTSCLLCLTSQSGSSFVADRKSTWWAPNTETFWLSVFTQMTREMSNLSMLHTFLRDDGNDTGWNISQHPERSWIYYHHLDQWSEKKKGRIQQIMHSYTNLEMMTFMSITNKFVPSDKLCLFYAVLKIKKHIVFERFWEIFQICYFPNITTY